MKKMNELSAVILLIMVLIAAKMLGESIVANWDSLVGKIPMTDDVIADMIGTIKTTAAMIIGGWSIRLWGYWISKILERKEEERV